MRRHSFYTSAAALALITPVTAHGQAQDEPLAVTEATVASRTTSYDAAFFAQFSPRSALDIARRVPGVALDLGDNDDGQDIRGFAGVAGNVVINGARPSSKAETLETLLQRIPAQNVVRVEVGPGDLYGADYSSKSQVLNFILSSEGGSNGTVTASARRLYTG